VSRLVSYATDAGGGGGGGAAVVVRAETVVQHGPQHRAQSAGRGRPLVRLLRRDGGRQADEDG